VRCGCCTLLLHVCDQARLKIVKLSQDEPAVRFRQTQVLRVPRVNQRIDQNRFERAQPGQQDRQHTVVVRVPRRPPARHPAAAFHDESEMAAIGFHEVLGIQNAATVINQMHEAHTATHRYVMSRTTRAPACLRQASASLVVQLELLAPAARPAIMPLSWAFTAR
jgi:hypothetical protein